VTLLTSRAVRSEDTRDFGEAQRLIDAADEEWKPMITVATKTGLRLGELIALRWRETSIS
jgi:integrase